MRINRKVILPNYLHVFLEESRCCICLENNRSILNKFLVNQNIKQLSQRLKISSRTIYLWLNGSRPISVSKLFELGSLIKKDLSSLYYKYCEYTFINGVKQKTRLPKYISPDLSYLVGYIFGDGHINIKPLGNKRRSFPFDITDASEHNIKIAVSLLKRIFNLSVGYYFRKDKNCYEMGTSWKAGVILLNKVFNMPLGHKHPNLHIPTIIKSSNKRILLSFIVGFLTADFGGNSLTQASYPILKEIKEELNLIGVKCKLYGPYSPYKHGEKTKWVLHFHSDSIKKIDYYLNNLKPKVI